MPFWIIVGAVLALTALTILRVKIHYSLSAAWPQGAILALLICPLFGLIRIRLTIAAVKMEKWELYYRIGRGRIRMLSLQKLRSASKKNQSKAERASVQEMLRNGWSVLKAVVWKPVRLSMLIGLQDAAHCALLCGLVEIILKSIVNAFAKESGENKVEITPSFNKREIRLELAGIATLPAEQISFNLLAAVRENARKRKRKKQKEEDKKIVLSASN